MSATGTPMAATSVSARPAAADRRDLAYQPALDGVRALAVAAVLLFHAEVSGFDGGYLGVSVFFTLSGFLITTLLVGEVDRSGRIAVGRFYARRARRLLPASIACILAIVVASALTDWFDGVSELRRHVVGSLLQVANWVFLAGEGSYQELFERAGGAISPLEHYWSLAIEEQFYWLWPLAFLALTGVGRGAARTRASLVRRLAVLTVLAAVAAPVIAAVWGGDAAYWATPARAAEILIGALLAAVIAGKPLDARWALLAPAALAVLAVCVVTFPAAGGPAYAGALPLVAVASASLLLGLQVEGPLRRGLSLVPIVWLGRVSYGVYLYHWPVYVVLDADRTGLDGVALLAVRLAVTLAIAQLSYTFLEQPIRRADWLGVRRSLVGAGAATTLAVGIGVLVVPSAGSDYWAASDEAQDAAAIVPTDEPLTPLTVSDTPLASTPPVSDTEPASTTPVSDTEAPGSSIAPGQSLAPDETVSDTDLDVAPPVSDTEPGSAAPVSDTEEDSEQPPLPELSRPVRIVVAGDSTALATGTGLVEWAAASDELAQVELAAAPGCGFLRGGERLVGDWIEVSEGCDEWLLETLPELATATSPDVVALLTTSWDVIEHRWDGGEAVVPTDPAGEQRIRADFTQLTQRLLDNGAGSVAWIRQPIPDVFWEEGGGGQEDPARHAVLYRVMDEIDEQFGSRVHVIDLPAWLESTGLDTDRAARPDGVHWTPEASTAIAEQFLGEQLIRAALDLEPR